MKTYMYIDLKQLIITHNSQYDNKPQFLLYPLAQLVEHSASSVKVMWLSYNDSTNWGMYANLLW